MRQRVALAGLVLWFGLGTTAPHHAHAAPGAAASVQAPMGPPAEAQPMQGADPNENEPPPSEFDRLGEAGRPSLAPQSFALVQQLGRTVLALLFVITLIYLFFRLGLPQVTRLWLKTPPSGYVVRERLAIDAKNSLVRIEAQSGVGYLLGVGEAGVVLLDKLPAPADGPLAPNRAAHPSFADALDETGVKERP